MNNFLKIKFFLSYLNATNSSSPYLKKMRDDKTSETVLKKGTAPTITFDNKQKTILKIRVKSN